LIEFDVMKDAENRSKHGPPLQAAQFLFDGPFIEEVDRRKDYGEARFIAVGPVAQLGNRIYVAVFTWRGAVRRIISFRKANDREVRKYRQSNPSGS
jgi:uncharacterized DUF497 family protein